MASTQKRTTKDGTIFYEIRVSRGRGKSYLTTRWYPPEGWSHNGRCAYQGSLNHWIYPALGDLKMPDITPANISFLLLSMQSKGKAHAICIKVYTILHSLFKMAYMSDVITTNPMDKVERPKPRKGELKDKDLEAYTTDDVQRIFKALEQEPLKWQALMSPH